MVRRRGWKARVKKPTERKKPTIRVDEHAMILKMINDASKELNKESSKNFLEMVYAIRNEISKTNGKGFSENEKKEIKDFFRRAKITMLLNDREQEFKALSQVEKDILKTCRS